MKKNLLFLLLGVVVGAGVPVAALELGIASQANGTRYAFDVPHQRADTLPDCQPRQLKWWGGICSDPKLVAQADFKDVSIARRSEGSLGAWWVPGHNGDASPTVVYAHGVGQ